MLKPAAAVTAFAVCAAGLSGCGSFLNSFKYLFTPEPTRSVSSQSQSGSAPAVRGQTRTGYGYDSLGSDELKTIYNTIDEQMSCSYSEEFTAAPMEQAELDALAGKTIGDLEEAGYEYAEFGSEAPDFYAKQLTFFNENNL